MVPQLIIGRPLPHSFEGYKAMLQLDGNMNVKCVVCGDSFTRSNVWSRRGWHNTQLTCECEACEEKAFLERLRIEGYNIED